MTDSKYSRGFTLTEVMIATVVAAISLSAIYVVSTQCLKQIWAAREASRAALVIDCEMERLRTMPWADIASSYAMSVSNNPALELLNGGSGTVQLTSIDGDANLMQATVSVAWNGRQGSPATNMSSAIIISKYGFLRDED